jgi:putative addiction module component (TIGR02574 family)
MSIAELRQLPNDEKLRIIETLWADIAADDTSFEGPDWHVKELAQTETDLASGKVTAVDWDAAKKELRGRFN